MSLGRIPQAISYASLRLCVLLRDLDARHLRLLWHGLRQGGWASIQKEVFPDDAVRAPVVPHLATAPVTPGRRRQQVLVIDRSLPRFDRDAGSRHSRNVKVERVEKSDPWFMKPYEAAATAAAAGVDPSATVKPLSGVAKKSGIGALLGGRAKT